MVCVGAPSTSVTRSKATAMPLSRRRRSAVSHVNPGGKPVPAVIDEAGIQLRAPWAASVAGILFAGLFTAALLVLRTSPVVTADDRELARIFATGEDASLYWAGLYLMPFAGIMFLWFIAVVRDQLGEREDRFFATVFFGSGLLFIALTFAAGAVASMSVVGTRYLGLEAPTEHDVAMTRSLAYALLFGYATRAAAVCLISIATLGLRSRTFPRWFAITGYLVAVLLLVVVTFWDWVLLLVPVWVTLVSVFILVRERARSRTAGATAA
jgi:hypothetical protein